MMTLIGRLCVLCMLSALMQMTIRGQREKSGVRLICGLIMLHMTLSQIGWIFGALQQELTLRGIFECLME